MDVIVNVNIEAPEGEEPNVVIKKPKKKKNNVAGGVLQFPENDVQNNNSILDMMGIGRT